MLLGEGTGVDGPASLPGLLDGLKLEGVLLLLLIVELGQLELTRFLLFDGVQQEVDCWVALLLVEEKHLLSDLRER